VRFRSDGRTLGISAASTVTAIFAIAGCGDSARDGRMTADEDPCPLGKRLESGTAFGGLVLGCGELRDGRLIQLRYRGGCLEVIGMDEKTSRGCSYPPSVRKPEQSRSLQRSGTVQTRSDARIEVYGVTLPEVDRVVLTYLRGGSPGRTPTELVAVNRSRLLRRASIEDPFGLYVGLEPATARRCRAVALDSRGEPLGVESCRPYEGLAPDAFILGGI